MDDNKAKKMRATLAHYENLKTEVVTIQNWLKEVRENQMRDVLGRLTINGDDWEAVRALLQQRWDCRRAELVAAMENL